MPQPLVSRKLYLNFRINISTFSYINVAQGMTHTFCFIPLSMRLHIAGALDLAMRFAEASSCR